MRKRSTASFVLVLTAALLSGALAAPAAHAAEPWEKAFEDAKGQQDERLRQTVLAAKGDIQTELANVARLVERYRQAKQAQGTALSHYLYGRILFKLSEGEGHRDKGKIDEAIRSMEAAKSRGAGWFATFALAYIHFRTGEVERGEVFLKGLLRTHGDRQGVRALHAQLLMTQKRWRELKAVAEGLIKENANDLSARNLLVTAYMGLKEWERALKVLDSMLLRIPAKDTQARIQLRMRRIECFMAQKRFATARSECLALIKQNPKSVSLRLVYADVLESSGDRKTAIAVMKQVVQAYPENVGYMVRLSELYLRDKQPAEAERVLLEALARAQGDEPEKKGARVVILRNLAFAAYEQKRYEATATHLEALGRIGKLAPHLLDLLQHCYARLNRVQDRIRTLERMLPHMEGRPEERKRLVQSIAALKRGETTEEPTNDQGWSRSKMAELVERCGHEDAQVRREALSEYYGLDLPFVDPVVYQRHDPRIEKDPECRRIVVQILGRFRVNDANAEIVRIASRYVGLALEDPDQRVRTIAAQELGRIGTPAGLLYLMPYFERIPLDVGKVDAVGRQLLEKEYNAARSTLSTLTGREDIEPGAPNWIKAQEAPAHRQAWLVWYDGPAGVNARLRALADLDTVDRVGPRWPLRYLLSDLMKKPRGSDGRTTPASVWVRTYKLLKRHILRVKEKEPAQFAQDKWLPTFPIFDDEMLTLPPDKAAAAGRIAKMRDDLTAWWSSLTPAAPPKKGS